MVRLVLCEEHKFPCLLKTGTHDGPNKHRSFYICGNPTNRCHYVKFVDISVQMCSIHSSCVVELQAWNVQKQGGIKSYFRCTKGKEESKSWCGFKIEQAPNSTVDKLKSTECLPNISAEVLSSSNSKVMQPSLSKWSEYNEAVQSSLEKLVTQKPEDKIRLPAVSNTLSKLPESTTREAICPSVLNKPLSLRPGPTNEAIQPSSLSKPASLNLKAVNKVRSPTASNTSKTLESTTTTEDICPSDLNEPLSLIPGTTIEAMQSSSLDKSVSQKPIADKKVRSPTISNPLSKISEFTTTNENICSPILNKPLSLRSEAIQPSSLGKPLSHKSQAINKAGKPPTMSNPSLEISKSTNETTSLLSLDKPLSSRPEVTNKAVQPPSPNISLMTIETTGEISQPSFLDIPLSKKPDLLNNCVIQTSSISGNNHSLTSSKSIVTHTNSTHSFIIPEGKKLDSAKADLEKLLIRQKASFISLKDKLPDKGAKFQAHISSLEQQLKDLNIHIENEPKVIKDANIFNQPNKPIILSKPLHADVLKQMYPNSTPLYGDKMNQTRLIGGQTITTDALEKLHQSIATCPGEMEETEDPDGLKVPLLVHQKQALTWLCWRETQHPSGGILADDMGLGKTLTMISLILKQKQTSKTYPAESKKELLQSSCTLVICPASVLHQWGKELERHCKSGILSILVYHGASRDKNANSLSKYDVILTTYNIVSKEVGDSGILKDASSPHQKSKVSSISPPMTSPLMKIKFHRIVLDEAHNIKNPNTLTAMAICLLHGDKRWAVTGTPVQNNLLDIYSLLKFLCCTPFDEYKVWKKLVDNRTEQGKLRLNTLVKSILLRRTKEQKNKLGKPLIPLPSKTTVLHKLALSSDEKFHYDKIFSKFQSILVNYLLSHEKSQTAQLQASNTKSKEVVKGVSSGSLEIKQAPITAGYILVLLLRLRQCCSHLSLLKETIDKESSESEGLEIDLVEQMKDLFIGDDAKSDDVTNMKSPVFDKDSVSTKIYAVMEELEKIKQNSGDHQQKSVIVSQWTQMLDIMNCHLKKQKIKSQLISGSVTAKKRSEIVEDFNNNTKGAEVLLVSLRAGGVGLNLIGGNHLFLIDMHWNPALESQACDRIYRVGQKNNVFIHRFVCSNTVEEKILNLQRRKLNIANNILSGGGPDTQKLNLEDLKELFGLSGPIK